MKNKHRHDPREPQPKPLEWLLRASEADLYGQVCWSIANRGTERPRLGEAITLNGEDEFRGHISETYLLTHKSIENIERCLGIKTCGEAVDLFTEERGPVPSDQPLGECPHGHQEAALAYMMYGIEPTEPCSECGETPKFSDPAKSLSFDAEGPVKGVDGQEYDLCPECGEDALELRGENPVDWGWNIACLNCDWEMKQAERLDIHQYCDLMEEVKSRVESINRFMEVPGITTRDRVESICLQLRMLLELIVFSSLVSNKDAWQKSRKELQSSQNISKKLKELKRIHPNFYPIPVDLRANASVEEAADREEGFLSEDQLIEVYGTLGNILHAENPMGRETDYRFFIDAVPEWISQIQNLLECHKVYLFHHPEEFYLIKMFGDVDGEVMPIRFKTTPEGMTKCAWPDCVSWSSRLHCEYIQRPWRECQLPELEAEQTQAKGVADDLDGHTG